MAIPIKATLKLVSKGFTTGINVAGKALGGFVALTKIAATAVIGLGAALTAITLRQSALIDRLGKVSAVTGLSTDLLQKFGFAAEQAGVSSDQAQVALRRFSRRLGEAQKGTGELLPALRRLGVETRNADGTFKSAEQVLFDFADGIANTDDASQRLALAFKAFDSEGAELVKTLENGSEGLKEFFAEAQAFGLVLDREAIQGVEDFNDALNKLVRTIDGQVKRVVAEFAPDLERVATALAENIKQAAEAAGGFDRLAVIIRNKILDVLIKIVETSEKVANTFIYLGNAILSLATTLGAPGTELTNLRKNLEEFKELAGKGLIDRLTTLSVTAGRTGEILQEKLGKGFLLTKDNIAIAIQTIEDEIKRLEDSGAADIGSLIGFADFSSFVEELKLLKKELEPLPDAIDEIVTTAEKLDLSFFDKLRIFFEDLPAKIKQTAELLGGTFKDAFQTLAEMTNPIDTIREGLVKAGKEFEDSLVDAITTGQSSFEDFRNLLRQTFARALVQKFITGPIFDLFRAKGGPVSSGQPYIVGEKGPELFVPGATGTIIPNNNLQSSGGMGAGSVTYNINAVDAPSFQQLVARDPEFIYNVSRAGARRTP